MKTLKYTLLLIALILFNGNAEAQFLKKLGKKTEKAIERGVERTVEKKAEKKAAEKTDQALESVFGIPKKVQKKEDKQNHNSIEGKWYYETLKGIPGYENLNDCGKKSNITYSGNKYSTEFYDNDCNLLNNSSGSFELKGNIMTVKAEAKDDVSKTKITTTQTILEHTQKRLVIKDDFSGAIVTLIRK